MEPRGGLISEIQQLLNGEHADPRAAQGFFLVPIIVDVLVHGATGTPFDPAFRYGLVIAAVPTIAALYIGRGLVSSRWTIWLPILDIVALGVFRTSAQTALEVAVAFPAIWLGLQFGRRGVVTTALAVLLSFAAPTFIYFGAGVDAFSRVVQVTAMAVVCAVAVAFTARLWQVQAAEARTSARRLAAAMADVIEQRRLTESIVASVDVGLVALDRDGRYDSMNPRQHDFMELAFPSGHGGYAGQTGFVYAADGMTMLGAEDMPTTRAVAGETFRDYLIWVGEDPFERRALAVSSTPHFDDEGEFAGAVLAYHDITDLVNAARIKDEFVASVSHELRTPLTSIIGYVDLMLDDADELPEDVRDHLGTVARNARRLHRLVDDLLSTALQSVTTVLDLEPVGLVQLVRTCAVEAEKAAAAAGLTFELCVGCPELTIEGDSERLAQVLDNLFSNAVKYTAAGGHVRVMVAVEDDAAVVRVCDTGRGIPASDLAQVFSKFFRGSDVQKEAIPGVGLGLAITKTIVDAHDGQIDVRSRVGEGTTFEVRLPLAVPPALPAA
jgi:signal transduction histidine kinase